MKLTPVKRPVDNMGRVVIPKEIRKQLNIENGKDSFEIYVHGDSIILKKFRTSCAFCNNITGKMFEFKGLTVCEDCLDEMNEVRNETFTTFE